MTRETCVFLPVGFPPSLLEEASTPHHSSKPNLVADMDAFRVQTHTVSLGHVDQPLATFAKQYTSLQGMHSSQADTVASSLPRSGDAYILVFAHALAYRAYSPVIWMPLHTI